MAFNDYLQVLVDKLNVTKDYTLLQVALTPTIAYLAAEVNYLESSEIALKSYLGSMVYGMGMYDLMNISSKMYLPKVNEARTGVSIFVNVDKLNRGIRTSMKMTKYLRLIGIVDNEDIKKINDSFKARFCAQFTEVLWAAGSEITDVYIKCGEQGGSLHSCMSYDRNHFGLSEDAHPIDAYNSPDISLAYMTDSSGRIKARTLINKLNKSYIRIYGDQLLAQLLHSEGYTEGDLKDCRMAIVPCENASYNGYALPYMDGSAHYVTRGEDWWVVGNDGAVDTNYDDFYNVGMVAEDGDQGRMTCPFCDEEVHDEDILWVESEEIGICQNELDSEEFVFAFIDNTNRYLVRNDHNIYSYGDSWYTENSLNHHNLFLYEDELYSLDDGFHCILMEEYIPNNVFSVPIIGFDEELERATTSEINEDYTMINIETEEEMASATHREQAYVEGVEYLIKTLWDEREHEESA